MVYDSAGFRAHDDGTGTPNAPPVERAEVPPPSKRDTVTLQWIAVAALVAALIGAAAYFSRDQVGGPGHSREGVPFADGQLRW